MRLSTTSGRRIVATQISCAAMDQYERQRQRPCWCDGRWAARPEQLLYQCRVTDGWQGVTTNKAAYAPAFAGMDPQSSLPECNGAPIGHEQRPAGRPTTRLRCCRLPYHCGIGSQVSQYKQPQQQLPSRRPTISDLVAELEATGRLRLRRTPTSIRWRATSRIRSTTTGVATSPIHPQRRHAKRQLWWIASGYWSRPMR